MPPLSLRLTVLCALLSAPAAAQQDARTVPVVRPGRADLVDRSALVGSVEPLQQAAVVPRVTGYLSEVAVDVGDVLRKGDVVARVSAPEVAAMHAKAVAAHAEARAGVSRAQAGIAEAQAMVADRAQAVAVAQAAVTKAEAQLLVCEADVFVTEREVTRKQALYERGAVTVEALEEAQGKYEMARARGQAAGADIAMAKALVAAAEARVVAEQERALAAVQTSMVARAAVDTAAAEVALADATRSFLELVCPFEEALVTHRALHAGAHVEADMTTVAVLMDVSTVRVVFAVPEGDAPDVRAGMSVHIDFASSGLDAVEGTVARTAGALDPRTRTMRAEVLLDNADRRLLPGMFCRGHAVLRESANAITLPGGAIRTLRNAAGVPEPFVWVVESGKVRRADVTLGMDDGIVVEITSGLDGSETVVDGNVAGLSAGDSVRAQEGSGP